MGPLPPGLTPGQILGERYRIVALLGRGGMGEVWRAYDLKLQVDVALKSILPERFPGDRGLELLRREVRAAREVMSPSVCRVFDLVDEEGREFVSMEYIDGQTLLQVLQERGPLDLREATRIASQFLAGLEAIHQAGLVHRDVKPENIMLTRTGRVVLMDFGIAKGVTEEQGRTIAGTPAYMAPEQLRGGAPNPLADIFAAGVVLAEMIAPTGVRDHESREFVWGLVRQSPVRLFESPWRGVLERAVSVDSAARFTSARELARALEEVTLRVEGAEDKRPYPGLESFTEADAEFFFGRELEVEAVWKKLQRANLLAIIGPSGAGKSSFVQAGLIPAKPTGWRHVILRPGASPFVALTRALAPELTTDKRALDQLLQIEDAEQALAGISRWREKHPHAWIVVDQFEELFTLCRPEVQAGFADLLGRLAIESDVHVLLVMRDDFLFRCHEHPRLAPIASDLTMLGPPAGNSLRRALIQPALLCGYRFEDESLADEILAAIDGERGALPMLAFAAARLWEQRDRERGLLAREAYQRIGGVSGALAQHAEAALERIGAERQSVVREIFRNLVTAQGTRAARDVEEILSVFPEPEVPAAVLRELVDARLLTSFEAEAGLEGGPRRRVEIVHESLLARWPRLVHWQAQDTEGVQLREQLRQAAQLWKERRESADLLWTGTAYKEFELWRERYPGGLTATEEAFAAAMTSRAHRQRRRRRTAMVSSFAAMLIVLGVFGWLWQRSVKTTQVSEARRLHMLAENSLETDNTLALALATASLERDDDPAVRRTALKSLWTAPTHFTMAPTDTLFDFACWAMSADGKWLAAKHGREVLLWPSNGEDPRRLVLTSVPEGYQIEILESHPQGNTLLCTAANPADPAQPWWYVLWSVPDGRLLHSWKGGTSDGMFSFLRGDPPRVLVAERDDPTRPWRWWRYSLDGGEPEDLGRADTHTEDIHEFTVDPTGRFLLDSKGTGVYLFPLDSLETARPILVGRHQHDIWGLAFDAGGRTIASADKQGGIRVWSREDSGAWRPLLSHQTPETVIRFLGFDHSTLRVVYREKEIRQVALLDRLRPGASPVLLRPVPPQGGGTLPVSRTGFPTDDSWIVFPQAINPGAPAEVFFYSLAARFPRVFRVFPAEAKLQPLCFVADGSHLITTRIPELRIFRVPAGESGGELLWQHPTGRTIASIASDSLSLRVLGGSWVDGEGWLIPLDGSAARALVSAEGGSIGGVALSPDGRYAAVGGSWEWSYSSNPAVIRVWDLETGAVQVLDSGGKQGYYGLCFLPGRRLVSSGAEGLLLWNLATGRHEVLSAGAYRCIGGLDARREHLLVDSPRGIALWDLEKRTERILPIPSDGWIGSAWTVSSRLAISPDGRFMAAGMKNGEVWVLHLDEEQPHLLLGHEGGVGAIWITPESDRIFTAAEDGTVRIWDVPAGAPLHTLPLPRLLEVLRAQTNLRIILDDRATDGYRIEFDRFPGWETAPTWQNVQGPSVASTAVAGS